MTRRIFAVGLAIVAVVFSGGVPARETPVDLVLLNGKVATLGEPAIVEAVAVRGNRIAFVGDSIHARALVGSGTRVMDLGGRLLVPGFIDSHTHFLSGSQSLDKVNLSDAGTLTDIQRLLQERARSTAPSGWILGEGWGYEAVPGRLPNRQDLDAAVSDRPVYLISYNYHTGWANSRALEIAKVTKDTPSPSFGELVRNAAGQPTGLLKEGAAMGLVSKRIPRPTRAQERTALLAGLDLARRSGLTGILNASGSEEELGLYRDLDRERLLTLRTVTSLPMAPASEPGVGTEDDRRTELTPADFDRYEAIRAAYPSGNVRAGTVKGFIDGVIETHTAAMLEPYADDRTITGRPTMSQEALDRVVTELDRRRFQIYIHSIGDRGVRMSLDAFEHAAAVNPAYDRRHRVDHIEVIAPADVPRFAKQGVVASMQAAHYLSTQGADHIPQGPWEISIGASRLPFAFNWRTIRDTGAHLCFGSDWPVASLNPLLGIRNATVRPDQRLTPEQALRAYTSEAAYVSYAESERGTLEAGKLADMVVLSDDILTMSPADIMKAHVTTTIFDGRVVYESEK